MSLSLREQLQATLEGSYTVGRELGGGGMSRVFVAEETRLGRRVVVKVLAPELTEGMSAERFAREVRLAARLQHPNIVPLLAAGERDGLAYYTMPYVEGESLRARLSREGRLSVDAAVSVLHDVARALEYAHEHAVVHRDIKPENILLTRGAASVADFGIAKALHVARTAAPSTAGDSAGGPRATDETLTRLGTSLGTPAYMAPEQAAGDPNIDARADIYSWGVVAYELLAGAPPFAGRTAHALVMAHIRETPPPLAERATDAPPALTALVMRCLEKDPAQRPQSSGELLADLEAVRTPAAPAAPSSTSTHGRRTRVAVVAGATLILVALGTVATVAWRARRSAASGPPVLAVLPFENLGLPADAYFADGLTDEVRSRLAGVAGLRVIGGTSARQYKGTTKSASEIARELGATHLLTGTVRWEHTASGGRVRVSPELVRASDQATMWAVPVDGALDDVFAMQTQVAARVAAALDVALLAGERHAVAARPTANLAAYDAYLRGLAGMNWVENAGTQGYAPAIAEFERAVALDPGFAAAHARLAYAYSWTILGELVDSSAVLPKTKASAARAWALDSTLVETRIARAASLMAGGEPGRAVETLRALADAAPGNAEVFLLLASAEEQFGRPERALEAARTSATLDPRSSAAFGRLADLYDLTRQYEQAVRAREQEIALSPQNGFAYRSQAWSYLLWRADTAAARHELERGGPALESTWLVWLPSIAPSALWQAALPRAALHARDTLTLDGSARAATGVLSPALFHYMKLQHFHASGRASEVRAHAESLVVRLAPLLRDRGDAKLFGLSLRTVLAEADAHLGRSADATREIDRAVAEGRRSRNATDLPDVLTRAAYIEVLIGRRDLAIARLTEAFQSAAGIELVSRAMLRADPSWAPLRGQPGFERLIAGRD